MDPWDPHGKWRKPTLPIVICLLYLCPGLCVSTHTYTHPYSHPHLHPPTFIPAPILTYTYPHLHPPIPTPIPSPTANHTYTHPHPYPLTPTPILITTHTDTDLYLSTPTPIPTHTCTQPHLHLFTPMLTHPHSHPKSSLGCNYPTGQVPLPDLCMRVLTGLASLYDTRTGLSSLPCFLWLVASLTKIDPKALCFFLQILNTKTKLKPSSIHFLVTLNSEVRPIPYSLICSEASRLFEYPLKTENAEIHLNNFDFQ